MAPNIADDPWFLVLRPVESPQLRLFCFPYAGGSATVFRTWPEQLPMDVEMCTIQLPGRFFRMKEPAFTRIDALLDKLEDVFEPYLDVPFFFLGHSMGAVVSYELTRRFRRRGWPQPQGLILSARRAPQVSVNLPSLHTMSEEEFINTIRKLNGTPEIVLNNPALMSMAVPAMRADFELLETAVHVEEPPLNIPIWAFAGTGDDRVPRDQVAQWYTHTTARFTLETLAGDHFFIHGSERQFLSRVCEIISES